MSEWADIVGNEKIFVFQGAASYLLPVFISEHSLSAFELEISNFEKS